MKSLKLYSYRCAWPPGWPRGRVCISGEHLQPVFPRYGQEFERYSAGFLGTRLPFLHGGFTRIEITGEDRLADVKSFTELFDLMRFDHRRSNQTGRVKTPHGGLVDSAQPSQRGRRGMDGFKCVAFESGPGLIFCSEMSWPKCSTWCNRYQVGRE